MVRFDAAVLLRAARRRAGLSQRQLAARARTSQSVVARIENGETVPRTATLRRLLVAAGADLRAELTLRSDARTHMLSDVSRILRLTPEQRLEEVRNLSVFEYAARRS